MLTMTRSPVTSSASASSLSLNACSVFSIAHDSRLVMVISPRPGSQRRLKVVIDPTHIG